MLQAYYFDRDDIALPNISKWFGKQSEEEREHAITFMKYQNTRGGRVVLENVQRPEKDEWGGPLEAFQAALALEKANNMSLLNLHSLAARHNDSQVGAFPGHSQRIGWALQMCDFLEGTFLREQILSMEQIGKFVAQLKRVGKGLGEFIFDKEIKP